MTRFRITAGLLIAAAALSSLALLLALRAVDGGVADLLEVIGPGFYGFAYLWWVAAPVLLIFAAMAIGRTPWLWVGCSTVHLVVVVATAARLGHWMSFGLWVLLILVIGCGVWSIFWAVLSAVEMRSPRSGSVGSDTTASLDDAPPHEGD